MRRSKKHADVLREIIANHIDDASPTGLRISVNSGSFYVIFRHRVDLINSQEFFLMMRTRFSLFLDG